MGIDRDLAAGIPKSGISRLLYIMRRLRDPETGCPWDIEQTFASIAPYTIEEAYEVADTIEREDWDGLEDELGDLLLQTVYHATIGEEAGFFDFDCIAERISDKMVERHPHIFGGEDRNKSADEQTRDWETAKAKERTAKGVQGVLDGVAMGLPALLRATKLQKRAARAGFDWPDAGQVVSKVAEEAAELVEARNSGDGEKIFEEFGDLLFTLVNLARHLDMDAEAALRSANEKFTRRFGVIEARLAERGKRPQDTDLAELDALWDSVKSSDHLTS